MSEEGARSSRILERHYTRKAVLTSKTLVLRSMENHGEAELEAVVIGEFRMEGRHKDLTQHLRCMIGSTTWSDPVLVWE